MSHLKCQRLSHWQMSEKQQTRTQVKKKASFTLVTVESMYQEMCLFKFQQIQERIEKLTVPLYRLVNEMSLLKSDV